MDYRIHVPDGRTKWIRIQTYGVRNEQGKLYRLAGSAEDVTNQKALEDQLRQAQKMEAIGQLAGGVAHDFNNLLTVIGGHSEFILDVAEISTSVREDAMAIQRAAEKAMGLTSQLLAFSRKQVIQPKLLVLNSVVVNVKKMLTRLIGEHIQITQSLAPDLAPVLADAGQIEQVLVNLVVNARDAMGGGGTITVETANVLPDAAALSRCPRLCAGPHVRLSVSDTGLGMDAATMARIFEPFFTTKEQGKGTGLGLATVHGIVAQNGGCTLVESKLGEGARFDILLPVAKVAAAEEFGKHDAETVAIRHLKILVVEDNAGVRQFTRRALEKAGHEVVEAADPEIALGLASSGKYLFDLVLTDVVMPKMSGLVMAERMAAAQPGLKILFMSGYTDAALVPHGILPSDIPFLDKPFTQLALHAKIDEAMNGLAA